MPEPAENLPPPAAETAEAHPHVVPYRTYAGVFASLLALTGLTVAASYFDFGTWNLVIAVLVATLKATLVALVFMHLLWDRRFNSLVLVIGLAFLGLFIALTMADTQTRGRVDAIEGAHAREIGAPFKGASPETAPPTGRRAPAAVPSR